MLLYNVFHVYPAIVRVGEAVIKQCRYNNMHITNGRWAYQRVGGRDKWSGDKVLWIMNLDR